MLSLRRKTLKQKGRWPFSGFICEYEQQLTIELTVEITMATNPEQNLKKLTKTPILMNFVKKHNGSWNHSDWEGLLSYLKEKGYFPLDAAQVGLKLEEKKQTYLAAKI